MELVYKSISMMITLSMEKLLMKEKSTFSKELGFYLKIN